MAKEAVIAREGGVKGLESRNAVSSSTRRPSKVPKSDRGFYDDSYATVYNDKGKVVERGLWDNSAYRDEQIKWNERDGNYDLPRGYKIVLKN